MVAENDTEIVVMPVLNATTCVECGSTSQKGDFLRIQDEKPLCLECADLDHLVFLPSGDAAMSRRSKKESKLWAAVMRLNTRRKRYERIGLLVEPAALAAAEEECAGDAESRAAARAKAEIRRESQDIAYRAAFGKAISTMFPQCPPPEAKAIADHACEKYSGRVGRTAMAKELDREAVILAVRAHIRHEHTPYDALLLRGVPKKEARSQIANRLEAVVASWRESGSAPSWPNL